jgi:hypothetical protein
MTDTAPQDHRGIVFPEDDQGRRSSLAAGRGALVAAMQAASPADATAIERERDWRHRYPQHVRRLVELGITNALAAEAIAGAGLAALHARFEWHRHGASIPLRDAMMAPRTSGLATAVIAGGGHTRPALEIPYRGALLAADDLRRQLDHWQRRTVLEPSAATAVHAVLDHPDWLDLSDWHVALLGAGAEIAPFAELVRWRANVVAVDVPRPEVWNRLIAAARAGNGKLLVPVPASRAMPRDDAALAASAGADLTLAVPELRDWLGAVPGPLCVGSYAYLDGEAHVRVSLAMDAIVASLAAERPDIALASLLTPTDVYAVPRPTAEEAMRRWRTRGWRRAPEALLRAATGGRLFQPNVTELLGSEAGDRFGVVDGLVLEQGPNYALAKRLQQWRALQARCGGRRVSANVAPATRTRSVTRNRGLAAAYRGAHRFDIEVFEPATTNALMAALLVHDLRTTSGAADPRVALAHPLDLFTANAVHGGVWRLAYRPRSALPLAALLGLSWSRTRSLSGT